MHAYFTTVLTTLHWALAVVSPRRGPILLRSYHPTQSWRMYACIYQDAPPATKLHPGAADDHPKQTAFEMKSPASNDDEVTYTILLIYDLLFSGHRRARINAMKIWPAP